MALQRLLIQRVLPHLVVLSLFLAGCRGEADRRPPAEVEEEPETETIDPEILAALPPEVPAELVREGQRHFLVCSVCHGLDGRGTALGPSLRGQNWVHVEPQPDQITEIIRAGVPSPEEYPIPMPPMGGGDFTEEQLRALSHYVYALSRSPG